MAESATKMNDWFTDALAKEEGVFVSGSDTFSQRVGSAGKLTLRIFGHHPPDTTPPSNAAERRRWLPPYYEIPFAVLTCELPDQISVDSFDPESEAAIRHFLSKLLGLTIYLVAYSCGNKNLVEGFHVTSSGDISHLRSPGEFAKEINDLRAGKVEDEPAKEKGLNKSLNDVFQTFTRKLISKQFSINDVDALAKVPGGVAFLELKRSGMVPWKPFLDDAANYLLMRSLTRKVENGVDFTIRYDPKNQQGADVHTILGISREIIPGVSKKITGSEASEVIGAVMALLRDPEIQAYSSHNKLRRQ